MKEDFLRMLPVPAFLSPNAVGLSIEDDGVALVATSVPVSSSGARYEALAAGVVEKGEIQEEEQLAQALARLTSECKGCDVVLSLPSDAGFLVRMEIDKDVEDVDEAVLLSIEEFVPVEPSELSVSADKIGLSKEGKQRVLVSAYPSALVAKYEEAVRSVGYNPVGAEMSAHSVARTISSHRPGASVLVLDLGRHRSRAFVVVGGRPWLVSTINLGWQKVVDTISVAGQMTPDEARRSVFMHGFSRTYNKELFNLMVPVAAALRDELAKVIRYWETHKDRSWGRASVIEEVYITGRGAATPGIADHLGVGLPVSVRTVSPFDDFAYDAEHVPAIVRRDSFEYAPAVGAYMRAQHNVW